MTPCCPVVRKQAAWVDGALHDAFSIICAVSALACAWARHRVAVKFLPGCAMQDCRQIHL